MLCVRSGMRCVRSGMRCVLLSALLGVVEYHIPTIVNRFSEYTRHAFSSNI